MNAAGLWWGLPAQWVQIELSPPYIIDAWTQRFLHGWYDAYPPIHFYVLAAALSPFLVLRGAAHDLVYGRIGHDAMFVVTRLVSLAAGAGIVAAIALIGARAFGRRAGLFAAAAFSVVAPFLFYAKTANVDVPYVFWFALSMVFYLRVIESLRATDFIAFAAAGMLAIGTKDQAWALRPRAVRVHRSIVAIASRGATPGAASARGARSPADCRRARGAGVVPFVLRRAVQLQRVRRTRAIHHRAGKRRLSPVSADGGGPARSPAADSAPAARIARMAAADLMRGRRLYRTCAAVNARGRAGLAGAGDRLLRHVRQRRAVQLRPLHAAGVRDSGALRGRLLPRVVCAQVSRADCRRRVRVAAFSTRSPWTS